MKPFVAVATGALLLFASMRVDAQGHAWLDFAAPKQRASLLAAVTSLDDAIRALDAALLAEERGRDPALRSAAYADASAPETVALPSVGDAIAVRGKAAGTLLKLLEPHLGGLNHAAWEGVRAELARRSPTALAERYPYLPQTLQALDGIGPSGRLPICRIHLAADAEDALDLIAAPDRSFRAALAAASVDSVTGRAGAEFRAAKSWRIASTALASGLDALVADSTGLTAALEALDELEPRRAFELAVSIAPFEAWTLAIVQRALGEEGRARFARHLGLDPRNARTLLRVFASALPSRDGNAPIPETGTAPIAVSAAALTSFESAFLSGREPLAALRTAFADPAARRIVFLARDFDAPRELVFRAVEALIAKAAIRADNSAPKDGAATIPMITARCRALDAEAGTWTLELGAVMETSFVPLDSAKSAELAASLLDGFLGSGGSSREKLAAIGIVDGTGPLDEWGDEAFAAAFVDLWSRYEASMRALGLGGELVPWSTTNGAVSYLHTGDPEHLSRTREEDPEAGWRLRVLAAAARAAADLLASLGELRG